MNNIEKSWNNEYLELFEAQHSNETISYDNDMMEKELELIYNQVR